MTELGIKIRKLRELKNLTQEHMAAKLKMTQQTYSRMESGNKDIKIKDLEKIAQEFGMQPEDILKFDEKFIFNNNQFSDNSVGVNYYYHSLTEIRQLYAEQIQQLKEENTYLKTVIDKLMKNS